MVWLHTVLAVKTIRGANGSGKVEAEIRYFLSSCGDDPSVLVQAIRRHWSISLLTNRARVDSMHVGMVQIET